MNSIPKVTVLMPVYNTEKYVSKAIESILAQTYTDFEFLIINDGSTDGSESIISSYADPRITYVDNIQNIGLAATLNKGIHLAKGKYIARMDPDDISLPQRLEKQVSFMETNPDIVVSGGWLQVLGTDNIFQYPSDPDIVKIGLLFFNTLGHPSIIFRKEKMIEHQLFYNGAIYAEDYDLWIRLSKTLKMSNIEEVLVYYRQHEEQRISKKEHIVKAFENNLLKQLNFLYIHPKPEEISTHHFISNKWSQYEETDRRVLKQSGKWLKKISKSNQKAAYFHVEKFNDFIDNLWFKMCNQNKYIYPTFAYYFIYSSHRWSMKTLKRASSLLRFSFASSFKKTIKLLLKSVFHFIIFPVARLILSFTQSLINKTRQAYLIWLYKNQLLIQEPTILNREVDINIQSGSAALHIGKTVKIGKGTNIDCKGKIFIGNHCTFGRYCKIADETGSEFMISDNFLFEDSSVIQSFNKSSRLLIAKRINFRKFCSIYIFSGTLSIGSNSFFNNYCSINCVEKIEIGENCLFGEGVKFYDHNHLYKDRSMLINEQGLQSAPIKIGNNCWFGSNTIILKGVEIGDNVIIGANNLIHKSVPSNTIVKSVQQQISESY